MHKITKHNYTSSERCAFLLFTFIFLIVIDDETFGTNQSSIEQLFVEIYSFADEKREKSH